MKILMHPNGTRQLLFISLIVFALMIVLNYKRLLVTHCADPQENDKFVQSPPEDINAHLANEIGSGPLSVVREKGYLRDLVKLDIDILSTEEILNTIHSYIDNIDILCGRKIRMGHVGEGGWEICDDPDVRPREPCIIYSFGINNDFSFDDDAARLYGCHVYSFDPSMTNEKDQFDRSSKVHFYKIRLDGKTYVIEKNGSMFTFRDVRKMLGHLNSTVNLVKMDIESSEWAAIPEMFETGELATFPQLVMEFHVERQERDYLLPKLKVIQTLEKSGLKKFYVNKLEVCKTQVSGFPVERTKCYEVNYIRR